MQNDNVKRSAHTIMTLLRICQASCFCHLISSLVKPTLWATPLNIKKTVGKAKQSSADAVPLQSATMDQLFLLDHDVKPVLSSCSEDHCGKCALILRSLIWLTEKGTPPCGCDDPSFVHYGTNRRIVWHHRVWRSSSHDKVIFIFYTSSFLYLWDVLKSLNVSC